MTVKWWISEDASIPPLRRIRRTIHVIYYPNKYAKAPQCKFNTERSKDLQLTLDQISVPGGWFHDRACDCQIRRHTIYHGFLSYVSDFGIPTNIQNGSSPSQTNTS
ncbi:uncharacterized protein EAE98_010126 [Botrytis deweyae]|uniref:Uncharacterized protein n=1 Tax=Botrytis deweyae TaxID=2478750 RepID=A0ABQ7IA75_9HELO|nr:uncharacterized protein EAE98_010126 [Botrytis deweyae]KAF7917710.1 hypothetical protein EAE98_010126 [Botrytis deweyae]